MELNKKEKFIKNTLQNADYKLDTDLLWSSIESRVEKPKKDRKMFWLFSGTGILVLALAIGSGIINTGGSNEHLQQMSKAETIEKLNQINTISATSESPTSDIQNTRQQSLLVNEDEKQTIENENEQDLSIENSDHNQNFTEIISEAENENQKRNLLVDLDSENQNDHKINNNQDHDIYEAGTIGETDSETGGIDFQAGSFLTFEEKESDKLNSKFSEPSDQNQKGLIASLDMIAGISIRSLVIENRSFQPSEIIIPVQRLRWAPFVSLRGGLSKVMTQSEIGTDISSIDKAEFEREEDMFGYSMDFQFGIENSKGWNFSGGIDMSAMNVRYANQDASLITNTVNGVTSLYTNRLGETIETTGQVNETVLTDHNIIWYRRHNSLNLGINLGKELFQLGRLSCSVESGIYYNIHTGSKGYYFGDDHIGFTKFESGEDHPYRTSGRFIYRGGINLNYSFENISIGLHSFYKHNQNSLTTANNFYKIKDNSFGFQLGVTYRPNWTL